jgi:ankyrin repeat protein
MPPLATPSIATRPVTKAQSAMLTAMAPSGPNSAPDWLQMVSLVQASSSPVATTCLLDTRSGVFIDPLILATRYARPDYAALFLARGASPNPTRTPYTHSHSALLVASALPYTSPAVDAALAEIIAVLVAHGADPNASCDAPSCAGLTALGAAIATGSTQRVAALVTAGANARCRFRDGNTPLHLVASRGRAEMARLLVAAGASTDLLNFLGRDARDEALRAGFPELAKWLRSQHLQVPFRFLRDDD